MTTFEDLPLFRTVDPETSQKAAADVTMRRGSQAFALLETYNRYRIHGLSDEQAGERTEWKGMNMYVLRVCYWKRCSDLRAKGFIEPTGETAVGYAGSEQMICRITAEGMEALRANQ
jgi:hypothetical protein